MSPSPKRGSSRLAPRTAQSLSPPTRTGNPTTRSGIPAPSARPSLSAFSATGTIGRTSPAGPRSIVGTNGNISASRAASATTTPTGAAGARAFRTVSAGTFRNNNPFAQRLQLAFAPATSSTGGSTAVSTEIGNISSSPIYDRQRTQPDLDFDLSGDSPRAPHTPPLHIIKSGTPKTKAKAQLGDGGKMSRAGTDASSGGASGIPQLYTSRFGSPSLFTPPPTARTGREREKSEAKLVSPTLDIPEPRLSHHQQQGSGKGDERLRAGSESPSPAAALRRGAHGGESRIPTSLPGQAARKSRIINQPLSPDTGAENTLQVSGLPNTSAGNKQRKPGVQRKTVPALSPDTAHAATLPHTRSPGHAGVSQDAAPRKCSPSTLSPPSFTQSRNGRSMKQPSVPILRGGGGHPTTSVQGRRHATSTSAASKSSTADSSATMCAEGGQLAPALPIVGRKDKTVHIRTAPSSPPPTRGETGDTTHRQIANSMTRSRSKSLIGIANDSPDARLRRAADAASARLQYRQEERVGSDLGVPEHIRFRLRTLHQLSRVLGFEQSDIAQEIDIPGLLGRVDRAAEKHKDVISHIDERSETRSPEMVDAFAKTVHPHHMAETPTVQMMAEALKQDWSAELKKHGDKGVGEETILGSPLELLPADTPFDVWPKTTSKIGSTPKEAAPASMSSSASQRSILDLDMMSAGGRFGASPSLSFATFGLGLTMADWTDVNPGEQDILDGSLLRLDQVKSDVDKTSKKELKKRNWGSGMISRFKSIGRKDVDHKDGQQGGDDSDDEEFWEGQTDRKRKAATIGVWEVPAFGLALTDLPLDAWRAVQLDGETHHVPLAASLCMNELWERGMSSPGLFRLAGGEDQVERIYSALNTPPFYGLGSDLSSSGPYSIAHVLKRFLRDLPEPLLDESLLAPLWSWCCAPDFPEGGLSSMSMHPAHSRRISAATLLLRLLPAQHLSLLTYTMAFISHLQCASENRLTLDAIAVVFGPAMLAPREEGVPGVGAGTKGEKSDAVRVAMLVDQSQKCLAWLVRYWPLIRPDLGKAVVSLPTGKPVGMAPGETKSLPASPGSPRHGVGQSSLHDAPRPRDPGEARGNQSLDIPRPSLGSIGRKSGLSASVSMSSLGLASSPSLGEMDRKTRSSSPLASPDAATLGGKLKASGSTASGLGGNLRSALSSMNLSAAYKGEEGLKVPKKSASFNNLSAVFKKGMGLGKTDRKNKTLSSTPSTPNDSPLLLTPTDSPDPGGTALPRSSLSCDGRPSSLFSTTSIANSQVSSVLGSLQDLLSSKDRQIERDARELAVLRYTLLEMNSKLSALSHSMPSSPTKSKPSCGCPTEHKDSDARDKGEAQASPIITITQSPSVQLDEDSDELIADLRSQLDNALAALAVSRETTLTKDKQLVSIHQTLARHRAERLSETNKLESQLLIEVAKNKGLREERDLAKVRLEKVKHELFKVM